MIALDANPGPLSRAWNQGFGTFSERAATCFGTEEIGFLAFVAGPEGLGGAVSYTIEPAWIANRAFFIQATDATSGIAAGPFYSAALDPALEDPDHTVDHQWVAIEGHFIDARAASCTSQGGRHPRPAEVVAICESTFVVTAIDPVAGPSSPPSRE